MAWPGQGEGCHGREGGAGQATGGTPAEEEGRAGDEVSVVMAGRGGGGNGGARAAVVAVTAERGGGGDGMAGGRARGDGMAMRGRRGGPGTWWCQ